MEHALTWLEPRPAAPVVQVGTDHRAPGGTGQVSPARPRAPGPCYEGLLGRTPAAHLVATDLLAGPDARAASLGAVVPSGAAVARQAAVWVHTGRLCPDRVSVVVPPQRRVHTTATVHRQRITHDDVVQLGGVAITTPVRTAVDLLCYATPELAVAGVRLLLVGGLPSDSVHAALASAAGLPTRRARALLARAAEPRRHGPTPDTGVGPC